MKLTLSNVSDDRKAPNVANNPPRKAVFLIPIWSTSKPEIGDIRNVAPINKDPRREALVSEFSKPSSSYLFFMAT